MNWLVPRRSCLSVPGHAVRMHEKAVAVPADEVVFDLEDAVAPDAKAQAREAIASTLARPEWAERVVAVRINAVGTGDLDRDLELFVALRGRERLTVVVPKVEAPEQLVTVDERLEGRVGLQALIETAAGVESAAAIAVASPRLRALILGYADLATSLGRRGAETQLDRWLFYQESVLAAARAAEVQAIDGPFLRLGDRLSLARAARAARELGFDGKWAIHPEQVEPLNEAFGATEREQHWAGRVTEALEAAAVHGDAAVRVDGAMVDEAMRAQAKRLLALPRRSARAAPERLDGPAYYEDLAVGAGVPRAWVDDRRRARGAAPGDRRRPPAAVARRAAVPGGDRRATRRSRIRCSSATWRSGSRPSRAVGCSAISSTAGWPRARLIVGTTLRTTTTVVAKRRASSSRACRGAWSLLHVTSVDADGRVVLDYYRCPLLPARERRSRRAGRRSERRGGRARPSVTSTRSCRRTGGSTRCGVSRSVRCSTTSPPGDRGRSRPARR